MTQQISNITDLQKVLKDEYRGRVLNFFGDEKQAMKFFSSMISAVQKTPELLKCDSTSVINSFMTMAQMQLMPSDVSGEAYVLPYNGKAQFQLGYQGLVTLFYRAGIRSIHADIVRENDKFTYKNGVIEHEPDVFSDDRGKAKGAYVIITTQQGGIIHKVMSVKEIRSIGEKFSKSFKSQYSPWNEKNDPELWMWKKTVLKQAAKLVPKNETIMQAIHEDNKDSNVDERMKKARDEAESMRMGNLLQGSNHEEVGYTHMTVEGEGKVGKDVTLNAPKQ